jgi:uncharacterized protein YjbI with pentapeptide repeats
MANEDQLRIIRQGVDTWNKWRTENPDDDVNLVELDFIGTELYGLDLHKADLSKANLHGSDLWMANLSESNLSGANLHGADLRGANLSRANLSSTNLRGANLSGANLNEVNLRKADLSEARLHGSDLSRANLCEAILEDAYLRQAKLCDAILIEANLHRANLRRACLNNADLTKANLRSANLGLANFRGARLTGANLSQAILVETDLADAHLTGCKIYGISAWKTKLDGAKQNDLIITPDNEPVITADNLEVAQFIYLLLHNEKIRDAIDTIAKKAVLILGRFTPERKIVLDTIKEELRKHNYLPILFDFSRPERRDIGETVSTLAHMARFIIADITDAKSIPAELQRIVPNLPSVPVMPLILDSDYDEFALFENIVRYSWVLEIYRYKNQEELISSIEPKVIAPAEKEANEIQRKLETSRRKSLQMR